MNKIHLTFILGFVTFLMNGQPCKVVRLGMTKSEVLKLAGPPTEIDTVISPSGLDIGQILLTVWQYGDVMQYGHQRVEFKGEYVNAEVIADGKKYDELLISWQHGEFSESELNDRIKRLNKESCK